jgi:GDP-4-dehydro-6-deoxy-D-mannose reductase
MPSALRQDQGSGERGQTTVLVTGAAGFVGSHLIELLERDASTQIIAWLRPDTEPLVTGNRVIWHGVELHDRNAVASALSAFAPSEIYHLAGVPHVGDSWAHVHETFAGNVLATHHLFAAIRQAGIRPRVLIASTAFVYAPQNRAITEHDPVRPNSPYGTSKLAQEMVATHAWQDDGIPALIARSFNHVGPRQAPSFVASSVAKQIAEIEARLQPPTLVVGNLESQRDIMDVRDTVRAYRSMMQSAKPGLPYNVCSGTLVHVGTLVNQLTATSRVPITIKQDPSRFRPIDTAMVAGDHSRLTADTGWRPEVPLEQTLGDLLDYWRARTS